MPIDAIILSAAIVLVFAIFASTMVWADRQTRPAIQDADLRRHRRRSF